MVAGKSANKVVDAAPARPPADELVEELRRRIVSHEWPPGARLREHELATDLHASRARIRGAFAPPETWDDLIELFGTQVQTALAGNDLDGYIDAIRQFRQRCIVAAANEVLKGLLDSLYDRIQVMIHRLVLVPGRAREGMRQHQEILRAMRDGDAQLAERLKRENIRSGREWFQNYQKYLL